jgi:pimeloyl-ACP methyl ester carboxylesterase
MIIGHSFGGLMGMMLASQHPEDVGKLLVMDSLPFFSVLTGAENSSGAEPRAALLRDTMLNESQNDYAKGERQFLHALVKSPDGLNYASTWAAASDKSVVARVIYEDMTTDLRPKLSQIKTPVTILYPWDPSSGMTMGMVDGIYKDNFAALPNKKLVRIDHSYHFIMFDQPGALERQIETFLK